MDLRNGAPAKLADALRLQLSSLQLASSGRSAYFIENGRLMEVGLQSRRSKLLVENVTSFSSGAGAGDYVFVREGKLFRPGPKTRIWADRVAGFCQIRPGNTGCLFTRERGNELWYASFREPAPGRLVRIASGNFFSAGFSPDGRAVLLLRDVPGEHGSDVTEIREIDPDAEGAPEKTVGITSRYASFSANADASVFVGASRSKEQPSIYLLVRSVGREFTLCEHRASDPSRVYPVFSPDNRRVYFWSDFQGRPAIYAVNVESLVEPAQS